MARARGANAAMALAFETVYGTPPAAGYFKLPLVTEGLGEQQNLVASDLLGNGRDPADPTLDVINNLGDVVVPVDLRNFGFVLKLLLGAPVTTQGVAASGSFVFSGQPAAGSTITIGGAAWTFVPANVIGDESLIGATLRETLQNAVLGLNASATAALASQSYSLNLAGDTIAVVSDTIGIAGNIVTLAAGALPASNATPSAADLAGGSAAGPYNHVFKSGSVTLPSASIEIGLTDILRYGLNYGVMCDKLAIQLQRSGLLNATCSCIAQGETRSGASGAGVPSVYQILRFAQSTGRVLRSGIPFGSVLDGNFTIANNLDKVEVIRADGRIGGADPGEAAYTGQVKVRFEDETLLGLATSGTAIDLSYGWAIDTAKSLTFDFSRIFLPRPKAALSGPGGIDMTYDWQGAKDTALGRALTVTLVNDVAAY